MRFSAKACGQPADPLILFLHGFPQNAYAWRHQMPMLAEAGFYCVAPNQRGYSPGARPPDVADYAVEHLVADAVGIADAVGAQTFHLVGHDWGGAVSWLVAAAHPDRLRSLSILSRPHPFAFGRAMKEDPEQKNRSRHHAAFQSAEAEDRLLADDAKNLRGALTAGGVPADAVEAYVNLLGEKSALTAAINWYRAVGGDLSKSVPGGSAALEAITVPTLYIWGDADSTVGPEAAKWTADYVKAAYRFETLPGVGHFSSDEAPDDVNRLLLDHIKSCEEKR
jgi:pimeloyl-ACP methyl ester carboxylesterase